MTVQTQETVGAQNGSAALENSRQISGQPGTLVSILGTNTGPDQFIQIHDSATPPEAGAVPLYAFPVPTGLPFTLDTPIKCVAGIHLCNSTTLASLTPGAADCWFLARHI